MDQILDPIGRFDHVGGDQDQPDVGPLQHPGDPKPVLVLAGLGPSRHGRGDGGDGRGQNWNRGVPVAAHGRLGLRAHRWAGEEWARSGRRGRRDDGRTLGGVVHRPMEQEQCVEQARGHPRESGHGHRDTARAGQGQEPRPEPVGGQPGGDHRREVDRDRRARQAGHGIPGEGQRPELVGQRGAGLDRPLDDQALARVELVVEVGGQEGFVVEVHGILAGVKADRSEGLLPLLNEGGRGSGGLASGGSRGRGLG